MSEKYIIAIEPSSSKIRGALGVVDASGTLTVKSIVEERLVDAIEYGRVRNVGAASVAIRNILNQLEDMLPNRRITGVHVALGGRSMGLVPKAITRRLPQDAVVTLDNLRDMAHEAYETILPERDVVTTTVREVRVDGRPVSKAVGTFGRQIDAVFNLINLRNHFKRNLSQVIETQLHLKARSYIVRQLAQAAMVLKDRQRELGCMLVDFGAETTTVSIYKDSVLVYLASLPMGSRNITKDIMSLNYLEKMAEKMKCNGADALMAVTEDGEIPADAQLNNLVAARVGEIIANIINQVSLAGLTPEQLPEGIVLVGGGSRLRGFAQRLEEESGMRVYQGMPVYGVKIADSHIRPDENIDILSVLEFAARNSEDCTEEIVQTFINDPVVEPEPEQEPEPEPAPEPRPEKVKTQKRSNEKKKRPGISTVGSGKFFGKLNNLKNTVARFMEEQDIDDNDDDLKDDD